MFTDKRKKPLTASILTTFPLVAVLASSFNANAAENYKLRQTPLGSFGGDIATPADKPGFFGTASLTQLTIEGIKGADGGDLKLPPPVPRFNAGAVVPALAGVIATVGDGPVKLTQDQTQINIAGGYLTESTYADGRIAFVANVPFMKQSRTGLISFPPATFSSTVGAADAARVNGYVQSLATAKSIKATGDASGIGDTELSAVWIRHTD